MSHFPTAHTSRLAVIHDKGEQSKLPSEYFQQEQQQVPQGPLHRPADPPKAGRLKWEFHLPVKLVQEKSVYEHTSQHRVFL